MNTEQAYINGFVKRANQHGFSDNQAIELLKESGFKPDFRLAGTLFGAGAGGLRGGIAGAGAGGLIGALSPGQTVDKNTGEKVDNSRLDSALKGALKGGVGVGALGALLGGGAGYRHGKHISDIENALRAARGASQL